MGRWIVRLAKWIGPPGAFAYWAFHFYFELRLQAIPAFGPVERHLDAYRQTVLGELGIGLLLIAVWVAAWGVRSDAKGRVDGPKLERRRYLTH